MAVALPGKPGDQSEAGLGSPPPASLASASIDGVAFPLEAEMTIYQFCFANGINLPCFCYHEKLTIAGNCRMCLVEVNSGLGIACAVPVVEDMEIYTFTRRLRRSREGILEFLLANHPLDCPICDQGGECDLQDISLVFGSDRGRFYESSKRSLSNINCLGPFVKTVMTRCIYCTRCVRFLSEVSGVFDLGVIGRGLNMEIGTYVEKFLDDELSANIIDLCPVGALTSMPYAFSSRPWELRPVESVDILEAVAAAIRIDVAGNKVRRILPSLDENVNEEWISNKSRFAYDSLSLQRLHYPCLQIGGRFLRVSFEKALEVFFKVLPLSLSLTAITGPFTDLETAFSLKAFFHSLGCLSLASSQSASTLRDFRFLYLLNATLEEVETWQVVFLIASNVRLEAPLVAARLRKSYLSQPAFQAFSLGLGVDYQTFPVESLGSSMASLCRLLEGKSLASRRPFFRGFRNIFLFSRKACLYPSLAFVLGQSFCERGEGDGLLRGMFSFSRHFPTSFRAIRTLSPSLGYLSSSEIGGFQPFKAKTSREGFFYLLGVEDPPLPLGAFAVYQGPFWSTALHKMALLFPSATYVEQQSSYLNLEGRVRFTKVALASAPQVYSDSFLVKLLHFWKDLFQKGNFSSLEDFHRILSFFSELLSYSVKDNPWAAQSLLENPYKASLLFSTRCRLINSIFPRSFLNYYSSDLYSRNSKVLSLSATKVVFSSFSKNDF